MMNIALSKELNNSCIQNSQAEKLIKIQRCKCMDIIKISLELVLGRTADSLIVIIQGLSRVSLGYWYCESTEVLKWCLVTLMLYLLCSANSFY